MKIISIVYDPTCVAYLVSVQYYSKRYRIYMSRWMVNDLPRHIMMEYIKGVIGIDTLLDGPVS